MAGEGTISKLFQEGELALMISRIHFVGIKVCLLGPTHVIERNE